MPKIAPRLVYTSQQQFGCLGASGYSAPRRNDNSFVFATIKYLTYTAERDATQLNAAMDRPMGVFLPIRYGSMVVGRFVVGQLSKRICG